MDRSWKLSGMMFALLVAFGVAARWLQPEWNFTPLAAVAIFAGYFFSSRLVAMLAPVSVMLVSNLLLPAYDGYYVMAAVYGMFLLPVLLGVWLRGRESIGRLIACGVVPAVLFFIVTNFAVWFTRSDYAPTLAGLVECYVAGIPFFRMMLTGDLLYLAVIFGAYALATQWDDLGRKRAYARVKK